MPSIFSYPSPDATLMPIAAAQGLSAWTSDIVVPLAGLGCTQLYLYWEAWRRIPAGTKDRCYRMWAVSSS